MTCCSSLERRPSLPPAGTPPQSLHSYARRTSRLCLTALPPPGFPTCLHSFLWTAAMQVISFSALPFLYSARLYKHNVHPPLCPHPFPPTALPRIALHHSTNMPSTLFFLLALLHIVLVLLPALVHATLLPVPNIPHPVANAPPAFSSNAVVTKFDPSSAVISAFPSLPIAHFHLSPRSAIAGMCCTMTLSVCQEGGKLTVYINQPQTCS